MQAHKTLLHLWRTVFSSFFSLTFISSKNIYCRRHYPATPHNFELSSPFLSRTSSTIPSVSAMFCSMHYTSGVCLPSRPELVRSAKNLRPKTDWNSWGRCSKPSPHQLGDLGTAVRSPAGQRLWDSACGHSPRYNKCTQFKTVSIAAPEQLFRCRYWHFEAPEHFLLFWRGSRMVFWCIPAYFHHCQ